MITSEATDPAPAHRHGGVRALRRHPIAFAGAAMLGVCGALALYAVLPNYYVAEAVVALDARKVQVITHDAVMSRLPQDSPVLRTEMDLIASRSMAEKVAARLELTALPKDAREEELIAFFNRLFGAIALQEPFSFLGGANAYLAELTAPIKRYLGQYAGDPNASAGRDVVDGLVSSLRINNDGRSYTIFISVRSTDPQFAARAANAYAAAYLDHQVALQAAATRKASDWLGRKLDDLRDRLEVSETAAQTFRRTAGLIETNGVTSDGQRLAGLNVEFGAARSQRAGAEARLASARSRADEGAGRATFNEVLSSTSIQTLRLREADIGRDIQEIEDSGALKSPELPARRVHLAAVRKEIEQEVTRVVASLANEVDVARAKERAVEADIVALETRTALVGQDRVQLAQLEREAAANRAIYESFLNRYKQTIEQEGLAAPDARLLSNAETPKRPASPKLLPLLAFGLFLGGAGGVGLAMIRDRANPNVRDAGDVERVSGAPLLGALPRLRGGGRRTPIGFRSRYAEAVRRVAASLRPDRETGGRQVIVVTSARAGEGCTTFCVALARTFAAAGLSVGVLNCPGGRLSAARRLSGAEEQQVDDAAIAISADDRSDACFLEFPRSDLRKQGATKRGEVAARLRYLRERFDIVLVDAPPVLASTTALQIGGLADAVVLTGQIGATPRAAIEEAVRLMSFWNLSVAGCVFRSSSKRDAMRVRDGIKPSPAKSVTVGQLEATDGREGAVLSVLRPGA